MQETKAWERSRLYVRSRPHALLVFAQYYRQSSTAVFICNPSMQNLAFLWEHQLQGSSCLAAGVLLELAAAGCGATLLDGTPYANASLRGCAMGAPLVLPENSSTAALVYCALDCRSGAVAVESSSGQQRLLTAHTGQAATYVQPSAMSDRTEVVVTSRVLNVGYVFCY